MRATTHRLARACALALVAATASSASSASSAGGQESAAPRVEHAVPFDLRLGVSTSSAKRTLDAAGTLIDASTSLRGAEARFTGPSSGIGIFGKYYDGTVSDKRITWSEGGLMLGGREFSIEGSYVRRTTPGIDSTYDFARAGIRSLIGIGGTGAYAMFAGGGYVPFRKLKEAGAKRERGWEGETGIGFVAPRIPVFVQLGYRFEHFGVRENTENVSSVSLSTGVWLGGR